MTKLIHTTDALTLRKLVRCVNDNRFFHVTKTCGVCGINAQGAMPGTAPKPARKKKSSAGK